MASLQKQLILSSNDNSFFSFFFSPLTDKINFTTGDKKRTRTKRLV